MDKLFCPFYDDEYPWCYWGECGCWGCQTMIEDSAPELGWDNEKTNEFINKIVYEKIYL